MQRIESHACFGGRQEVWSHASSALGCEMRFGVYLPPQAKQGACPVLYWLSGLTCSEQNFITKSGAQRYAAEHGLILVAPDTSPRGEGVADAEGYDIGLGAGFYVNATQAPWAANYRMHDYVVDELPALVDECFATNKARAISGHSMGGHGALVIALRNPGRYRSVSAFSPIVAPSRVPWGEKAFTAYLGEDRDAWREWDAVDLVARAPNGCRCSSTRARPTNSWPPNCARSCCATHAPPPVIRCSCACIPATTTAITSSPVSSANTSPGMPKALGRLAPSAG